ncbi:hypothetical protein [Laspinema olomoucense]|uniref:hypothetical protein n=1 Tax=Laspinema olomoucense TaxID=3231600 RepID=UPI0021BA56C7|nr:hypothetical protein [Laspinema sp. D3d]MCT7971088.1 hypothetical protein [Laspinema sp. D3d]
MATLNLSILSAAEKDGLIGIPLSKNQELYLVESVVTANKILLAIERREDTTAEQLEADCSLARNTLNMFLRWLEKKDYIYSTRDREQHGHPKIYFRKRRSR